MRARREWRLGIRALPWLLLPLLLGACGGGGKKNPAGPVDEEMQLLYDFNARENGGRTVRWANLPIRVFTNGIAQEDEVTEWTRVTGGKVTFAFGGGASAGTVSFRFGNLAANVCAVTLTTFDPPSGGILSADVQVAEDRYRGPGCGRTITHEVGHAIGFFEHTADGGLMDEDGGNGQFTDPVITMMRALYSLPPGTAVARGRSVDALGRRGGGRAVMVFVRPVRR